MSFDLEEIMNSQPGAEDDTGEDDLGYIGMPRGYVATTTPTPYSGGPMSPRQAERRATPQITPPKYKIGSEMEPRSYSPEMIARLQQGLAGAGLIGPETRYRLGVWDSTSITAYKKLLSYANQGGMNREDALQELLTNPAMKGDEWAGGTAQAPQGKLNTFESSDPASVRQTAEAAFKQALGRKPNSDEMAKFTSAFLGRERGSQEVVFAAQDRLETNNEPLANAAGAAAVGGESNLSESDLLWNNLQRMIADAPGKVTPGKRSRSYEEQVALYAKYKAGKGALAAKPGTSKHGNGRANDLKYDSQATKRWVLENAHRYGLAFPLLNHGEDWHIELAGDAGKGATAAPAASPGAAVDENVTVQRQDVGAQAVEFARAENPTETAAFDIGGQFQSLVNILGRSVV